MSPTSAGTWTGTVEEEGDEDFTSRGMMDRVKQRHSRIQQKERREDMMIRKECVALMNVNEYPKISIRDQRLELLWCTVHIRRLSLI